MAVQIANEKIQLLLMLALASSKEEKRNLKT